MKTRTKISILLMLLTTVIAVIAFLCVQANNNSVSAEEVSPQQTDGYIVSDDTENVAAAYEFVAINETECSVRITNKTVATKAIIPSKADIDGSEYKVTEVAGNGFTSSPKLIRVSLPNTIQKIGANAFSNCAKLNRINLANVVEIGNGAFNRCPELSEIVIPKSVTKIGTYVLRGNNTQVRVRAAASGQEWADTWNKNNTNQNVEYDSKYIQPLELEPVYNTLARSADNIAGYSVAGGQPRNDNFYGSITEDNRDEVAEQYDGSIFIPAQYNGKDVLNIATWAFSGAEFDQLIVEYSQTELCIANNAFEYTVGTSIVINRTIRYYDEESDDVSNSIFSGSQVSSIVLPNTLTSIADSMFFDCADLSNIYFIDPEYKDRDAALNIISNQNEENGVVRIPGTSSISSIGDSAFNGTVSIYGLHLDDTVTEVGASILGDWDNDSQTVYIHNSKKITGWSASWNSNFTNIIYDNAFYTATFDPNGGKFVGIDEISITKDVIFGKEIGEMPDVTKENFAFNGWESSDKVVYTPTTIYNRNTDIVLTAVWGEIVYNITFDQEGGYGGTENASVTLGRPLPPLAAPTREGYTFQGYYELPDGQGNRCFYDDMQKASNWDIECDITVYAYWLPINYTVQLYSGYGNNQVIGTISNVHYEQPMPFAAKPERVGYTFLGYYDSTANDGRKYYNEDMDSVQNWDKTDNGELYAHWKFTNFTVYLHSGYDDDQELVTVSQVHYEQPMPFAAKPERIGYTFLGYYDSLDAGGRQYYNEDMDSVHNWDRAEDGDLYARWELTNFTIQLYSGYGNNKVLGTVSNVYYDQPMPLAAKPERVGYTFLGYYDSTAADGKLYYNSDMSSANDWDKADNSGLYARWQTIQYNINYQLNGGKNRGDNPTSYNIESDFTLKAAIHDTLYFAGWTVNGKKVTSLKGMTGDITLVATWTDVRTITITQPFSELNITDRKVEIIMAITDLIFYPDYNIYTINIASSVEIVGIFGNGREYDMAIVVENRQTDFGLYLHNISIVAPQGQNAIKVNSNKDFFLFYSSYVTIKGNSPDIGDGGIAISCKRLIINTVENNLHRLTIQGGNGSNGASTLDGVPISNGNVNGGNGGFAVHAQSVIIACDFVTIAGGLPGNGGNAYGSGGYKGYGGYGVYPVLGACSIAGEFENVLLLKSKDGSDGIGNDPPTDRPFDPNLLLLQVYPFPPTDPTIPDEPVFPPIGSIDPTDPDMPLFPPIGDIILPTSG